MNIERGIFEQEETAEQAAALDAKARASGKLIPHEKVVEWLKTWGTPEEGPPPREWFE